MKLYLLCFITVALFLPATMDLATKPESKSKAKQIRALEDSELIFANGIRAWLKKGSKLIHPPTFNGKDVDVILSGEGGFEVSGGYRLAVRYDEILINATGASFSVMKGNGIIEIAAHKHQVLITVNNTQTVVSSSQRAIYDTSVKRITIVDRRIKMT